MADVLQPTRMDPAKVANDNSLSVLKSYLTFDQERQSYLAKLINDLEMKENALAVALVDLDHERSSRRAYQERVLKAEAASSRNRFVTVLVDGDGYIFQRAFLQKATTDGGAEAANGLNREIMKYVDTNLDVKNVTVMINVYVNKCGLAKALVRAGYIADTSAFDAFLGSFNQSQQLFQFIDCGTGKEIVDVKLKGSLNLPCLLMPNVLTNTDAYKFFIYNNQCDAVFLACCHDNGYVAELKRYNYDQDAVSKTVLVKGPQPAKGFTDLLFRRTAFNNIFEPELITPRPPSFSDASHGVIRQEFKATPPTSFGVAEAQSGNASATYAQRTLAIPTYRSLTSEELAAASRTDSSGTSETTKLNPSPVTSPTARGVIYLNRLDERLDEEFPIPTREQRERFERHTHQVQKFCNDHHLRGRCSCDEYDYLEYNHGDIDDDMLNALRFRVRRIRCKAGSNCRRADCFYGHNCPLGDKCNDTKCKFKEGGQHYPTDTKIAKSVRAED